MELIINAYDGFRVLTIVFFALCTIMTVLVVPVFARANGTRPYVLNILITSFCLFVCGIALTILIFFPPARFETRWALLYTFIIGMMTIPISGIGILLWFIYGKRESSLKHVSETVDELKIRLDELTEHLPKE